MTKPFRSVLAGAGLILAMLACNTPFEQFPPPDEVQTAAALTLQAILTPSPTSDAATPDITATASPRVTRTVTEAVSSTTSITPTHSVPLATVREATNCRTGPGEAYEVIITYVAGKELEIVGRYDPENFWLVKSNESPTGTCWLWGQFVDVTGSFEAVPSVTPPATSTSAPPSAATLIEWNYFCSGETINFAVTWRDNADNESGYRILRNGEQVAELATNSTTYTEAYTPTVDQSVEYYIQVFGPSGLGNTYVGSMRC